MVFLTGGTGYMGRRLGAELQRRGRQVTALVRRGSEAKAPPGCAMVIGDALSASSYRARVPQGCSFVHLAAKAVEFRAIDLASIRAAVEAQLPSRDRKGAVFRSGKPLPYGHGSVMFVNATILRPLARRAAAGVLDDGTDPVDARIGAAAGAGHAGADDQRAGSRGGESSQRRACGRSSRDQERQIT